MFVAIMTFLFPALLLLVLIATAAPVSRLGNLIALALAALASGLAYFALPEALRATMLAQVAMLGLGNAGPALIASVATFTTSRLLIALATAVVMRKPRVNRPRGAYGPPHGFGGWFALVLLRLFLEPVPIIVMASMALASPWSTVTSTFGSVFATTPVPGETYVWWVLGMPVIMLLLWLPLMRALVRRTRSFRAIATVYFGTALVLNAITFALEIAVLGGPAVLTASGAGLFAAMVAIDGLLLAYVLRSRRVRATFRADPRTAPSLRAILWRFLGGLIDLSAWSHRIARSWRGEASIILPLLAFPFALVGYFAAQIATVGLVQSLAVTATFAILMGFLAISAWRAALRISSTRRFGALALPLAALPIVAGATLVSHQHSLDLFFPGRASVQGEVLRIEGGITSRLLDVVPRLLRDNPAIATVELDSPGGRGSVGTQLADIIRRHGLSTRAVGGCESACTFLFIAGRERDLAGSGRLGFHGPSLAGFSIAWNIGEPYLEELRRLGATPDFLRQVTTTPSESMWYPTQAELIESGILTRREVGQPAAAPAPEQGA